MSDKPPTRQKKRPESPLVSALKAQLRLTADAWAFEDRAAWKSTKSYMKPGLLRLAAECKARARGLNKVVKALLEIATVQDKQHVRNVARECRKLTSQLRR